MKYFANLIEQSLNRAREATLSVLGVSHDNLRRHLSESMKTELGSSECFLASPVFEHTFGWQEANTTLEALSPNLISKSFLESLNSAHAYNFAKSSRPYTHQIHAWRTLMGDNPRSAVITSGTGSGKTECFMIPILDDLVRERERTGQTLVGVRALFLYPLNALINSQQERLDAWTRAYGKDIRFCLYNGKTEESETQVRKLQQERPNQIMSRQLLRREPAPILMTNATMLEYMLVRQVDNPILEISRNEKSLRWIVLDEAHTYIGSQAAEMSLLLRRVVQAFGMRSEEIRFIATSATIAGDDAKGRLQSYLAALAGVKLDQVEVIGGLRVWPEIVQPTSFADTSLEEIASIEPSCEVSKKRFDALCKNAIATKLRHSIVAHSTPRSLDELVADVSDQLTTSSIAEKQFEVLRWIDVLTGTKSSEEEPPFLKLRAHFFQRMLHGLWACANPKCTEKPLYLNDWPFGRVYVSQRARCNCDSPVYELGFCAECKTPHLSAEDRNGTLRQISAYAEDEFELVYEQPDEDLTLNQLDISDSIATGRAIRQVLAPFDIDADVFVQTQMDVQTLRIGALNAEIAIPVSLAQADIASCSSCGFAGSQKSEFLKQAYLGSPFYVANAVPTVLEYCPDPEQRNCNGRSPEELPGRGRKLITFTDSRQGTARMAVRMQQEAERSRLRGLVFGILQNGQAKSSLEVSKTPSRSIDELLETVKALEAAGQFSIAASFRLEAENMKHSASASTPRFIIDWHSLVDELAAAKDIEQSILNYNRYANPQLFDRTTGPKTVARLLLAREYSRRPKNQNSTETLGLVKVSYKGLESIQSTPIQWSETKAIPACKFGEQVRTNLTLQDWKDYLKVALDFYVRENTFIKLDEGLRNWMGSRFTPKALFAPTSTIVESSVVKKWPQIKKGQSSRLIRLLETTTNLDSTHSDHRALINKWLEAAWQALIGARILEQSDLGHTLRLETLEFSMPEVGWVCPITNRIFDTTFRGLTPYLPHKRGNLDYRCKKISLPDLIKIQADGSPSGRLEQIRNQVENDTRIKELRAENLWTDVSDRVVEGGFYYRTAEHSAQQSDKKLEEYVEQFKAGTINVLNCSTTMEMGVDIGGISAVVMNNVPPHPANYLQRAGRAGRRSESRAISYTLCKKDPHNQRVLANPKWPFITAIPAPIITLSSERIVQRHVNSLLLSIFLRTLNTDGKDRTKLTVKWFFGSSSSLCDNFISWLDVSTDEFEQMVQNLVVGTILAARSVTIIAEECRNLIAAIRDRWVEELKKLNSKIENTTESSYKKALELERTRHEDEYLLRDLAVRAFLPGYGFPTDVVSLNTYNVEDFNYKKNYSQSREDSIFNNKEMPSRGLNIAIREYAPGAQIVIDGRVYRSAGVSLQWHNSGQKNEAQKFDIAWICKICGASGVKENAYANSAELKCTHCLHSIHLSSQRSVLRPSGFVTDFFESTSNDVSSQKFIRVERPRIHLVGDETPFPDPSCGYVRYGHNGSVFYHSSGENEKGYAVCLACGRAESMLMNGDIPNSLRPDQSHRPVGGIKGAHKIADCSGTFVKSNVYLGYQITTDVIEIFLRNPSSNMWLSDRPDDQIIAMTMAVAIRNIIAKDLGISSAEMGFGIRLDRDFESGQGRSVVQIYDEVSGGAGFVLNGLEDLSRLIELAIQGLICDCENVCSKCLAETDSRVEQEELDRKRALKWFTDSQIEKFLSLPREFSDIKNSKYCSVGPQRYMSAAVNNMSSDFHSEDVIDLFFHGDTEDWNVDSIHFRKIVLIWRLSKKIHVRLVIPSGLVLGEELKRSLAVLSHLGVEIVESDSNSLLSGVYVAAQLSSSKGCITLLSNNLTQVTPGDSWLAGDSKSVWVTTESFPKLSGKRISTKDWDRKDQNAHVFEITSEFNGPVSSLEVRLRKFIDSNIPELATLLSIDQPVSISYCDRYLKSPWTLILLSGFLEIFKSTSLREIAIQTLSTNPTQQSYYFSNDWKSAVDQQKILKFWLETQFSIDVTINMKDRSRDLQHGRTISIKWASGKISKIVLDQGMGYWQARMPYKDQALFDFDADYKDQIREMVDKYQYVSMIPVGEWPTYVSVIAA